MDNVYPSMEPDSKASEQTFEILGIIVLKVVCITLIKADRNRVASSNEEAEEEIYNNDNVIYVVVDNISYVCTKPSSNIVVDTVINTHITQVSGTTSKPVP